MQHGNDQALQQQSFFMDLGNRAAVGMVISDRQQPRLPLGLDKLTTAVNNSMLTTLLVDLALTPAHPLVSGTWDTQHLLLTAAQQFGHNVSKEAAAIVTDCKSSSTINISDSCTYRCTYQDTTG